MNRRVPILDGWRGVAIALVLVDHLQGAFLRGYWRPWSQTGQHGVTLFFVLSGYLITTNLIQRDFDFKQFYIRRFFRLMPAAWLYLTVMFIAGLFFTQQAISLGDVASCVFFFRNYWWGAHSHVVDHFWSLSMEEQFYLLWPAMLFLLGSKRARWFCVAVMAACACLRTLSWSHIDGTYKIFETQFRADAPLAGCLCALLERTPLYRKQLAAWGLKLSAIAAICFVACFWFYPWLPPLFESVAIALLLSASALHAENLGFRWLTWRPLTAFGLVSYSAYLWQNAFLLAYGEMRTRIILACMVPVAAVASYLLVERPLNRYGHALADRVGSRKNAEVSKLALPET